MREFLRQHLRVFFKISLFFLTAVLIHLSIFAQNPPTSAVSGTYTQTVNPIPLPYTNPTINSITEWTVTAPGLTAGDVVSPDANLIDVKQTTQYLDGLGRPVQTVQKQITPLGNDMVSPVVYDGFGREVYKYLPYPSATNDGSFKTDPFNEQEQFYYSQFTGERFYYSKTNYEPSPLNRVTKTLPPGNSWAGSNKGTSIQYLVNTIDDNVRLWNIGYASGALPTDGGAYDAGQLYKTIATDESGNNVVEFKDKEGHVILKKVESGTSHTDAYNGWVCTYYVYDDLGNLRFVMQPKAVSYLKGNAWAFETGATTWNSSAVAKGWCFSYEYDERQRLIIKRVPDAGEVYMVYDARDRLVMTQDENLRTGTQKKWLVTVYDELNRPVRTGLWNDNNTRSYHQNLAGAGIAYPNTSTGFELLTETYYDNYQWITDNSAPLKTTMITTNINTPTYFYTPDNATFPYPQPITANYQNRNLTTGTKTEVTGTGVYLYSVNFYDDRGRLIQAQSMNYSSSGTGTVKDTVTMQYSFSGQVLRTLVAHKNGGNKVQFYRIATKNEYDNAGRLQYVKKRTGNQFNKGMEVIMAHNTYDELGQLKEKDLGQQRTSLTDNTYTAAPVDALKYDYNIRGWLRGINKDYARGGSSTPWFGMELCYDYGFTNTQLTGNIAGERWRSKGDGEQRAYGFSYDMINRLTNADYNQLTGTTWDKTKTDFTTSNLTYDLNGNILTMNQQGMNANTTTTLDQLQYNYAASSNKLDFVKDNSPGWSSTLGDFKEINNNTSQDYYYDGNGNLTKDNNKNISAISYNYLNLPAAITVTAKGTITYTYDAAGNKLRKLTTDNTVSPAKTTTTDYIGPFTYTNDTLQYISTEEGRARTASARKPNASTPDTIYYDYFEKDHLGNVRVVLTDQMKQDVYPVADVESTNAAAILAEQGYYDIKNDAAHITDESSINSFNGTTTNEYQNNNGNPPYNNNPSANSSANSTKLYKLNGATGDKTGLGITLKVMSGDIVNIFGKSYYHLNSGQTPTNSYLITNTLLNFLNIFAGSNAVTAAHTGITGSVLNSSSQITDPLNSWLNSSTHTPPGNTPQAYINWVFLDEQFNPVTSTGMSGASRVADANNTLKLHAPSAVNITRNGYLYIYCSNESNIDVFFDNLQVIHTHSPLVEETHYYPFGLTMSGISSQALNFGNPTNKKLYNGKELQNKEFSDNSGLELYDFGARMQDPQLGRWWTIDPKASDYFSYSPYNYVLNNPLSVIDPTGQSTQSTHTDSLGNVLAVFNDGDNGVYKHDGNATTQSVEQAHTSDNTSAGGTKMGETEYWDEFAAHDASGDIVGDKNGNFANFSAKIEYGNDVTSQMNGLMAAAASLINSMPNGAGGAYLLYKLSHPNQLFDIKKTVFNANTGYLFNGKFVSGESLGNYYFGANLETLRNSSILDNIAFPFYNKLTVFNQAAKQFGPLQNSSNGVNNAYAPPYYGEIPYAGRQVTLGYWGNSSNNPIFNTYSDQAIYGNLKIK